MNSRRLFIIYNGIYLDEKLNRRVLNAIRMPSKRESMKYNIFFSFRMFFFFLSLTFPPARPFPLALTFLVSLSISVSLSSLLVALFCFFIWKSRTAYNKQKKKSQKASGYLKKRILWEPNARHKIFIVWLRESCI